MPRDALVAKLDNTPGWRRIYTDPYAVVHVRTDASPTSLVPPKFAGAAH